MSIVTEFTIINLNRFREEEIGDSLVIDYGTKQETWNDREGIKELVEQTIQRIRVEMLPHFSWCLSNPTLFVITLCEELNIHSRDVKQAMLRQKYSADEEFSVRIAIALSEKALHDFLNENYGNELKFLSALNEDRLEEAREYLEMIALVREQRVSTPDLLVELSNWRIALATKTGDIEAFLAAFFKPRQTFMGNPNVDAETKQLADSLASLVHNAIGSIAEIVLSAHALTEAKKTQRDPGELLREQDQLLSHAAMHNLAKELAESTAMTSKEFTRAVYQSFNKAALVLSLSPYIQNIIVQEMQ